MENYIYIYSRTCFERALVLDDLVEGEESEVQCSDRRYSSIIQLVLMPSAA